MGGRLVYQAMPKMRREMEEKRGRVMDIAALREYYCSTECEKEDVERFRRAIEAGEHPMTLLEAPLRMLSERTGGH